MAIYRGSGGANEATDAATNQAAAAAEYARQASESALDTQALYDTFDDTYLGSKAIAPTLDNDGDTLSIGALYFDSVENKLKVYSDIGWIDSAVASPSSFTSQAFSGTGVQTVFTLSTAPSSIQSLLVFVSGLRLRPTLDYTVSSTTLTFTVAPANATNNISVLVVTTLAVGVPDDNSISTAKIQNGAVSLDKLTIDSVDSSKIVNGTIVVGDLNASVLVASNVTNTPAGTIAATNVQTALNELDSEKVPKGGVTTSSLTQSTNKLLGRSTASTGAIEELTVGSNLTLSAGTLSANNQLSGTRQLAQTVTFKTGAVATGPTSIPHDNTIPQITEGDQYMSLAITPTNASSTLEITVTAFLSSSTNDFMTAALFQDSTANALTAICPTPPVANYSTTFHFIYVMTAGTTSTTTFKLRAGKGGVGTTTFNGEAGAQLMGGVMASRITIKEYLP